MPQKNRKDRTALEEMLTLAPGILELLKGVQQVELENFSMESGISSFSYPGEHLPCQEKRAEYEVQTDKPAELLAAPYVPQAAVYQGKVREVTLGGTKSGGGSRGRSFTIGGATPPAYSAISNPPAHDPVVSLDVFDMEISLPRVLPSA